MRTRSNVTLTSGKQALAVALLATMMGCNLVIAADDVPDPGYPADSGEVDANATGPDSGDPIFRPDAAAPGPDASIPPDAAAPGSDAAIPPDAASPGADAGADAGPDAGPDASTNPDAGCAPVFPAVNCSDDEWTCSGGASPEPRYASGACWEPTSGSGQWCCTPSCDEKMPAASCTAPTPRQIDCFGTATLATGWSYEEADCKTTGGTSCCPTVGYREMDGGTACAAPNSATLHTNGISVPPYSVCEHGDGGATWCCEPECLDRGSDPACPTALRPVLLECAGNRQPSGSQFTNCAPQSGRRGNYCCDVYPDAGTPSCVPAGTCGNTGTLYQGCTSAPSVDCYSAGAGDYCCGDTTPPDSGMPMCNATATPCGNGGMITTCDPGAPAPPGCASLGGNDYCCGEVQSPDGGTVGSCTSTGNVCGSGGTEVSCTGGATPGSSCSSLGAGLYCCGGSAGIPDGGATTGCTPGGTFCQGNVVHTAAFFCSGATPGGACFMKAAGQYCCAPNTATSCGSNAASCGTSQPHSYTCMSPLAGCSCAGSAPAQCCCPD